MSCEGARAGARARACVCACVCVRVRCVCVCARACVFVCNECLYPLYGRTHARRCIPVTGISRTVKTAAGTIPCVKTQTDFTDLAQILRNEQELCEQN